MKNTHCLLTGTLSLLLFISCEKSVADRSVIDVATAMSQLKEIKASDCFTDIRYIPLQTTDSSLVGNSPDIRIVQDRILVASQKRCLLFDKATGDFIKSVGHIGNDPGGYSSVDFYVDELGGLIYFKGWHSDLVCYDLEGNYLYNVNVPVKGEEKYPTDYSFINKDTIVGYYDNITGDQKERILFFDKEGKELAFIPNEQIAFPFEIVNVSVFKGEKAVEIYGPSALRGTLVLNAKDPDILNISMLGKSNFGHLNNETYFKEAFNDTIYKIKNNTLVPRLVFDLGTYHWEYSERFIKKKDRNIYISEVFESNQSIFFRFIIGFYNDNRTIYNGVFDKLTGRVKVNLFDHGILDDINHFMPLQPLATSRVGEYVAVLSAEDVLEWFDKNQKEEKLPTFVKQLKSIKEDDNPIVVLMKD